jgi:hypothetical protein
VIATPKRTTTTVPGIHQRRPKRRIPRISSAPPAPHSTAPIACDFATSPAQPSHDWVTSPTSFARSRATALTGSVARPSATEIAAVAAAPVSTGCRAPAARSRGGALRTTRTRTPSSISSCAPKSQSCPVRKSCALSSCAELK